MEIVDRPPQSWTDKGMNWAAPDPLCADYIAAIVGAINERRGLFVHQLEYNRFTDVVNVTRCQPLSADDIRNLNTWAVRLIPDFVNILFLYMKILLHYNQMHIRSYDYIIHLL